MPLFYTVPFLLICYIVVPCDTTQITLKMLFAANLLKEQNLTWRKQ